MNLERALVYLTHHSESIIQWVFLAILLLAGLLIARALMGKGEAAEAGAGAGVGAATGADLNAVVEKIMAQMSKLEGVSLKDAGATGVAEVSAQVEALKKDLAAREVEIAALKASGGDAAAAAGAVGGDVAGLNTRIKELEAKLAEYEILEDDIADLSLYKEENTRLRAELEKTKGGAVMPAAAPAGADAGAAAAASAAASAAAAAGLADMPVPSATVPSPEPQSGEAIVAEFAQAVSQEPEAPVGADPAANMEIPDTGNPMADFESTVKLERELAGADAEAAVAAPSSEPVAPAAPVAAKPVHDAFAAPAAAAPSPAAAQAEADDLFAEFSTAIPDSTESSTLDTDKMMEEMAALVGMEPSAENALEDSIDMEKMSMEASTKKS